MEKEKKQGRLSTWWQRKTKGQKVSFVFSMFFFVIAITILIIAMDIRPIFGNEAADNLYKMKSGVDENGNPTYVSFQNGWAMLGNAMATSSLSWLLTIITIAIAFTLIVVINFLTRLFSGRGRKGKTLGALIRSLTKYVVILLAIAFILGYWGVDVSSILAGVGILTLIIGLGCQTLIQDVIAGLFIVFDDYFAVGDICIVDGFRGTIIDIGLKTTKIKDAGGNIKSINNSSITTVVDLSREDSIVSVSMAAGYNEDPVRVEGIIIKALPEIEKKLPQLTAPLVYKGISSLGSSDVSYMVLTKCREADRFQVTRDLNRELLLLFIRNDIQVVFPQITINQPDEVKRPKTTPEQIAASEEVLKELRARPVEEKEEHFNFFQKARQAVDQTATGVKDSLEDK